MHLILTEMGIIIFILSVVCNVLDALGRSS
jgi:hypothetical protein